MCISYYWQVRNYVYVQNVLKIHPAVCRELLDANNFYYSLPLTISDYKEESLKIYSQKQYSTLLELFTYISFLKKNPAKPFTYISMLLL